LEISKPARDTSQHGAFLHVVRGIALHAFGRLDDLQRHGRGGLDVGGFFVGEDDFAGQVLRQVILHLADEILLEGDVVIRNRVNEVVAGVVLVAELVLLAAHRHDLQRLVRVEALHERLARAHAAQRRLHEGAQVARRAVLRLEHHADVAVEFDGLSFSDFVCVGHGNFFSISI
jgi:hypothetical protein